MSLAQPNSWCLRTELIVLLERGVCSHAEVQVFSCYRVWKEACHAMRAISTTLRSKLSSSFFFSTRQGTEGNTCHSDRNIREACTIICHCQKLGGPVQTLWFFHLWWVLKCLKAAVRSNDFLSWLVPMDETWLYHYGPETKQQSMEWRHSGSPCPTPTQKFPNEKICWKSSRLDFFGSRWHSPHWLSSKGPHYQCRILLISAGASDWRTFWRKNTNTRGR